MTESKFEQKWSKKAAARGWLPIKIIQANMNGLPDRMYLKDGKVFFVEFKSATGKLRPLQQYRIEQLRKLNFHCLVIHDKSHSSIK
jgi:hypothetical protein